MNTSAVGYNTSLITAIVDENPFISQTHVQGEKIMQPSVVASLNHILRNGMTSSFNPFLNTTNRQFRRTQPKKHQSDLIPLDSKSLDQRCENLGGKSGFEGKRVAPSHQLIDAFKHNSTCLDGSSFRIKRRNPFSYLIGIYEFPNIQGLFQHTKCGCCLTGSIATREHNQSFHQCLN